MRHVPAAVGDVSSRFLLGTLPIVLVTVSTFGVTVPSVGISQSGTAQTTQAKLSVPQQKTLSEEEVNALRQKAEQGDATAQYNLGLMYFNGQGVPQDYAQAAAWYRKAADQRHAEAQCALGLMYFGGQGVPKDLVQAVAWLRKAADQGVAAAQWILGNAYEMGLLDIAQDYAQAVAWYRKAAEQGIADAQCSLGNMYELGQGVTQDYANAVSWYRKAADQGDAVAQFHLGVLCRDGHGVSQDSIEAYKWLSLATTLASRYDAGEYGTARDTLAQKIPPAQLAEAQKRASEWMAAFETRKK